MGQETGVQSQVESYRRLQKWYLIPPCLTLRIIRYVSRVKWNNPGKGVAPSPSPWCSSYWKGRFWVALDYGDQLYFTYMSSPADSMDFSDSLSLSFALNLSLLSISHSRPSRLHPMSILNWYKFLLVNQHWYIYIEGSIKEHHLWICLYFSSSILYVLFVLLAWFLRIEVGCCTAAILCGIVLLQGFVKYSI